MAGFFKNMDKVSANVQRTPYFSPGEYPRLEVVSSRPFEGKNGTFITTILKCVDAPIYREEHLQDRMKVSDQNRTHFRQGDLINFQIAPRDKFDMGLRQYKSFILALNLQDATTGEVLTSDDVNDELCEYLVGEDQPLAGRMLSAVVGVKVVKDDNGAAKGAYTRINFKPYQEEEEEAPTPPKQDPPKPRFGIRK